MPRIAVGNHKGGSGKTASTVNLAAALAEAGHRVLVVDLDPQANASRRLGYRFDPLDPAPTISEAVHSAAEGVAARAVVHCGWPSPYRELIDLTPSRFDLENRIGEASQLGAVGRLTRALAGVDDEHTVTLIDLPPSLGHLTQLGLAAADLALCTVEPEYDSVEGAIRFRDFVTANAGELGGVAMIGYLIGRVRAQVGAHAFQLDGLAEEFGEALVWHPYIPERAAIKDAGDTGVPLRKLGGPPAAAMANMYADHAARLIKEVAR